MTAPPLYAHQEAGVAWLHQHPRGALWLDMGLGKTATVLTALTPAHLPALVVTTPRIARDVWPTETALWRPDLKARPVVGTIKERRRLWTVEADVYSTTYNFIEEATRTPLGGKWRTVILDESSAFKSPGSKRFKQAKRLVRDVPHVWELTGTPAPNGLMDLWAQVFLLDRGARLGKTITAFRDRYFNPGRRLANGVIANWEPKEGADQAIHQALDDVVFSMTNVGRVDLPEMIINPVGVILPDKAVRAYQEMRKKMVVDLTLLGGVPHSATSAAALSNRLSQIAAGVIYHDDQVNGEHDVIHTAKMEALDEILAGTPDNLLVFYRYKAEWDMITQRHPEAVHVTDPTAVMRWNRGEIRILGAHPASAAHGLNLQHGGHTTVWTTPPWSLDHWLQANKRLHRPGQKHTVMIHVLTATGTIDERVLNVLEGKERVQDALLNHLEIPL